MASKLFKRAGARESKVQALAFDTSSAARLERMRVNVQSQWHKRVSTNVTGFHKPPKD